MPIRKKEIFTPKIGRRYETIYYYKQKLVNWSYVAPSGYVSFVTAHKDQLDTQKAGNIIIDLDNAVPISIFITRYITEETQTNFVAFYEITFTLLSTEKEVTITRIATENELTVDPLLGLPITLNADNQEISITRNVQFDNINACWQSYERFIFDVVINTLGHETEDRYTYTLRPVPFLGTRESIDVDIAPTFSNSIKSPIDRISLEARTSIQTEPKKSDSFVTVKGSQIAANYRSGCVADLNASAYTSLLYGMGNRETIAVNLSPTFMKDSYKSLIVLSRVSYTNI